MTIRIFSILLVLGLFADDGEKEGRRGNELYSEDRFRPAVEAYQRGLASLAEDAPLRLRYGLLNNLGAALLRSGDAETAGETFARALDVAPENVDVARTSYNAGNAAYATSDLETALAHYRKSLLANSHDEAAKFNYEFVKRQIQQQQQEQQDQGGRQNEDQDRQDREQEQQGGDQEQEQQNQGQSQDEQEHGGAQDEQESSSRQDEEGESQAEAEPSGTELSEEQAERILQALQNEEEKLLREVQRPKSRPRQVEKDW